MPLELLEIGVIGRGDSGFARGHVFGLPGRALATVAAAHGTQSDRAQHDTQTPLSAQFHGSSLSISESFGVATPRRAPRLSAQSLARASESRVTFPKVSQ